MSDSNERDGLEIIEDSTTAENIHAWKELLSSNEAKEFVNSAIGKLTVLFGQTPSSKVINSVTNIALMVTAFTCIGLLGWYHLVSDGTTGTLAGMIIGYFFKRNG